MKKYLHSKKSEIATVVALVLMVAGLVGSIFTAGMMTKNKIATNSRAAMLCEINRKNCITECGSVELCSSNCTKQYIDQDKVADRICITQTPTPTSTSTPAEGGSLPATSTPTSTPDFSDNRNILNTKGKITGLINFICGDYCRFINNFNDHFIIDLVKENSGFFDIGKIHYSPNKSFLNNTLAYVFENIDRFYGNETEIKPNIYSLKIELNLPNGIRETLFEEKNFQFNINEISKTIKNIDYDWTNLFAKVTLNFNYVNNIQKPVILIPGRAFLDNNGNISNLDRIYLWEGDNQVQTKDFIYFLGYFIGADNSIRYEILWNCLDDDQIVPRYSSDPSLYFTLEGGKTYEINTVITCN